jgi:hypothetical protein
MLEFCCVLDMSFSWSNIELARLPLCKRGSHLLTISGIDIVYIAMHRGERDSIKRPERQPKLINLSFFYVRR